jgi:hypothetical protein
MLSHFGTPAPNEPPGQGQDPPIQSRASLRMARVELQGSTRRKYLHDQMVKGVLTILSHGTPLFSHPEGPDQVAHEGPFMMIPSF